MVRAPVAMATASASTPQDAPVRSLVRSLVRLLRDSGEEVVSGRSLLTLPTATLRELVRELVRELEPLLGPRGQGPGQGQGPGPGQGGFVALPSHPSGSTHLLGLQFLFDVLQSVPALKLVHWPGPAPPAPPGPIHLFPFKSLRQLELHGVPLQWLRGLRGVYSSLQTLVCSHSLKTLQELLSGLGGDQSSALPWLALLHAHFGHNALTGLDGSLDLLSAVRVLDLSHNRIRDCAAFLAALGDLSHLDLSYNLLSSVPLGPPGVALGTLILRGNELRGLAGLERLEALRHLDVAYNLLETHEALEPLGRLGRLRRLHLEGNPLWFHPDHRAATARRLSPRAAANVEAPGFLLDGEALSPADLRGEKSDLPPHPDASVLSQPAPPAAGPPAPPRTPQLRGTPESSCGAELSDSPPRGVGVTRPALRRGKSRVRVRRASISEPSDTDPDPRTPDPSPAGRFVQQQRELELMSSFRERFGQDWLQYRSHLETPGRSPPPAPPPPPPPPLPPGPRQLGEPARGETAGSSGEEEEEEEEQEEEEEREEEEEEEEGEEEAELCGPVLVRPVEDAGPERFLRVTRGHVAELELRAGRALRRLSLRALWRVEAGTAAHPVTDPARPLPCLALHFTYVQPGLRVRRYLILDDDAEGRRQELLTALAPAAAASHPPLGEAGTPGRPAGATGLHCLRCGRPPGSAPLCPCCGSDHVVLLPAPAAEEPGPGDDPPPPAASPGAGGDGGPSLGAPPPGALSDGWNLGPRPGPRGLRSVDHRLRLFLDVEVFGDADEEFQFCLQVPLVLGGRAGEFPALVVASDHRLYLLEVTGEMRGDPSGWLRPCWAFPPRDLRLVELGLAGQSVRLDWTSGGAAGPGCVLLTRDPDACRTFLREMDDLLQAQAPGRKGPVTPVTAEEMTPQHRLWPLLDPDPGPEGPRFFYLLAFLVGGRTPRPVSVLVTPATLYLLDEDHRGPAADGERDGVRVRERQPISSLSSVVLYRSAPRDVRLVLYDEVLREENFWALRLGNPELLAELLAWIRGPWEELFSIALRTLTRDAPDPDPDP
ncbi:serine/threonine-protein kinase 11-interacting protein [Ornithorhynchus anatinus]|uniref:serine/threonine-protein kinase 11-interacting protein n=1 Tax=Ornithorhynchus anatinus TaxID=9258 RepID=UPI0019D42F16|nr:serine/threonine-protein kinase 11-interacting protein [Ornithorhynchus anatinus]